MIADSLRSQIEALSSEERHELAAFLTKLELESDEDYWSSSDSSSSLVRKAASS